MGKEQTASILSEGAGCSGERVGTELVSAEVEVRDVMVERDAVGTAELSQDIHDGLLLVVLGGEPCSLNNQIEILKIIKKIKRSCPDKNIWLFTGYVFEKDLLEGQRQNIGGVTESILGQVDVLVDGPFVLEERDLNLRFRGSRNQRLLTMEDRPQSRNVQKLDQEKIRAF